MSLDHPIVAMILEKKRAHAIVLGLLLLMCAGVWGFQSWSVDPRLRELGYEQSQLQQHVRQRQLESARSGVPVSTAEQVDRNLAGFAGMIPQVERFSLFVGELFDLADQASLQIHQIDYQPEDDEETGYLRYAVRFSVKGDYGAIKTFIYLLEQSSRILLIENISLSGAPASQRSRNSVNLNIELATYFQEGPR